ncbi:MAG: zinc-dependent alcohol dehydrogenase [Planctomycetota bacterium]
MKALVLKEYNQLAYEDVPEPEAGPDDVLIQVKACGICGSDVHGLDGSTGRRIPPVIMGHEASGVIARAGTNASEFAEGDRVTFDSNIFCGSCEFCRAGQTNLCDDRRVLGVSCDEYRQDGAFAEFVAVPQHILYGLPEGITFEQASTVEPLSVAYHGVSRLPLSGDDTAVVVGAGMIGLMAMQALRAAGCARVVAVDLAKDRLEMARELGADGVLSPEDCDVAAEVREMTDGQGADVAVEAVGVTPAVQTAVNCLKKGGALALIGNVSPTVDLPLQTVVTREISLHGSYCSTGDYPVCLDLIVSGRVNVDAVISAVAPLAEGASWFERLYNREPGLMKVILAP